MLIHTSFIVVFTFIVGISIIPSHTNAHHHHKHHKHGNQQDLNTLLTAGVLAKVLQKKGGHHHHPQPIFIPFPVPIHHDNHHQHNHHHQHAHHQHHQRSQMQQYQQMPRANIMPFGTVQQGSPMLPQFQQGSPMPGGYMLPQFQQGIPPMAGGYMPPQFQQLQQGNPIVGGPFPGYAPTQLQGMVGGQYGGQGMSSGPQTIQIGQPMSLGKSSDSSSQVIEIRLKSV